MRHLTQQELADRWRLSPRTLERWRSSRSGPAFLKLGNRCLYPISEIEAYEQVHLRGSNISESST
jgi:hypothetical protein